ncbi:hypothetical protein C8J57DRAFT_1497645 [Mycena rebaudengoi]|nr:hypothetical protein C8J57DRAFT_1497645 [Mycena rebaudengoi]
MVFVVDWGMPGVNIQPPPLRDGYTLTSTPQSWSQLQFTPIGRFDLRRNQGIPRTPGVFQRYQTRWLASDLAWFAADLHKDGSHLRNTDTFFPEFEALRDSLPPSTAGSDARKGLNERIQNLTFDLATAWDRLFGGTTMILHVEGTTVPNTPPQPQFLLSSIYLPPFFVAANPASHGPIAQIAQLFIESVGVPTVQMWRNCALQCGWSLTANGPGTHHNPYSTILIPRPQAPGSAHYKFHGRAVGVLDTLLAPTPVVVIPDDDFDEAHRRIQELEEQETILFSRIAALEDAKADLQGHLDSALEANRSLRQALGTGSRPPPSTPTRSQAPGAASARTHTATPSRSQAGSFRTPASARTAPSTLRRPPPYSPSPSHGPTSRHGNDQLDLDTFITSHGLTANASAIKLVMRSFHPVKWHAELINLDIELDLISDLLFAMAAMAD